MADTLAGLDATAQAELVRRKEISPRELVDAAIARIERLNPRLNAVITPLFEKARAHAASAALPNGPFRGVPFLMKDLDSASGGDPMHCGMKVLRDINWTETNDSYLVEKFRAAGLVCVGKSNTPELGLAVTTEPAAYGACHNPWNLEHSTGGSSGGSAAAVAAGLVPIAHASDGGGSIRIPASECGLVGLKPSRGRVSLGPDQGEAWHGLVISHVVSRSVRDTALALDAVAGAMPGDPYTAPPPARPFADELTAKPRRLRVGIFTKELHPDCAAAVNEASRFLQSLGHEVESNYPPALDEHADVTVKFSTVVASWVAVTLDVLSRRIGRTIGPDGVEAGTWALAEMGRGASAPQYLDAVQWLQSYTRRMASWWASGFDVLVTPTLGAPPPRLGELLPTPDDPLSGTSKMLALIPFTPPFNITGQPAISLPLHWNAAGLPIGVQLVGAYGREDVLIQVAAQLEQAQPWAQRHPPVFA
jgi:amidase